MDDTLTAKQAAAIWALISSGGQGKMPAAAADPGGLLRKGLIRKGYRAGSRAALAEVTDKGWSWAEAHLIDPVTTPKPLLPWFGVIKAYLDAKQLSLAEMFVAAPEPLSPEPVKKVRPPRPKALTPKQLRQRIEDAYLQITGGRKSESVPLSKIRSALPDLSRATVDKALGAILKGDKKARLGQISDPKAISAADKDAAFNPAGEPQHHLWINQ